MVPALGETTLQVGEPSGLNAVHVRPVAGGVVVSAGVDAQAGAGSGAQQPQASQGFAADLLGLVEPADLGHREHPAESVVEVEFERVVTPALQPVEQVRGRLELTQFAMCGGAHQHPAERVVGRFGETQRQRGVRGGSAGWPRPTPNAARWLRSSADGLGGLEQCGHRLPLSVIRSAQAAVRCIASRNAGSSVAVLAGCDQWAKLRTRRATPDSRRGSGVPTGSPTPGECRDLPTGPDASVTATPGRGTGSRRGWGDSGVRRNDGARGDRHPGLLGACWEMTPFAGMTMSAEMT